MLRRVVVTGIGGVSALGRNWESIRANLLAYENKVIRMDAWEQYNELNTRLAAPIVGYKPPENWTRKQLRSLGPVSQMCVEAAGYALEDAGLLDNPEIKDGRMGGACGSSTGSTTDKCTE